MAMQWIEANGASLRYELTGSGPKTLGVVGPRGHFMAVQTPELFFSHALPFLDATSSACSLK